MNHISNYEKIEIIKQLIQTGSGDTGRLNFILECLKNQKPLFKSDQLYLENKIANFTPALKTVEVPKYKVLESIAKLLENNVGDSGRLTHIYDSLISGKKLFNSDNAYLEEKLEILSKRNKLQEKPISVEAYQDRPKPDDNRIEKPSIGADNQQIKNLTEMLLQANDKISRLESLILKKQEEMAKPAAQKTEVKLRGSMPKGWSPTEQIAENPHLTGLYEKINLESQRLDSQKKLQEELTIHQSKLTQIILDRQEYEKQVEIEQRMIEEQIQQENNRIEEQTQLIEQITASREELEEAKKDRERIALELKNEKNTLDEQIRKQKLELEQIRDELKNVTKEAEEQKSQLTEQIRKEKEKLSQQDDLMNAILDQSKFLEQVRQERMNLAQKITQEREKIISQYDNVSMLKSEELSLQQIKKEKEELVSLLRNEELELQKIKKEKEKIQREISTKLERIEQTKREEKDNLTKLILSQQNISKQIFQEKERLSEQAIKAKEIKQQQEELDKARQSRSALERQIKEAKTELALIKRQSRQIGKQLEESTKNE